MRINTLNLAPFAGVANQKYEFKGGLNVILGPNETGKSTLVNALRVGLFIATDISTREFNKHSLAQFLPLGAADVFKVEIGVTGADGDYTINKSFGAEKATVLSLPDGNAVVDSEKAQGLINDVLGFTEGTWKGVLFCGQSEIGQTMKKIDTADLEEFLGVTDLNTDGVSIEELLKEVEGDIEKLEKAWDPERSLPKKKSSGGADRWAHPGAILDAYYQMQDLKGEQAKSLEYETRVEELHKEITTLTEKRKELEKLVETESEKEKYTSAQNIQSLKNDRKLREKDSADLIETHEKWLKAIVKQEMLKSALPEKQQTLELRKKEQKQAVDFQNSKTKLDTLKNAGKLQQPLEKAQKDLAKFKKIEPADVQELHKLNAEVVKYSDQLKASKFSVTLEAKKRWSGRTQCGLGTVQECELEAGQEKSFIADGQAIVETDALRIVVQPSEFKFAEVEKDLKSARQQLDDKLESLEQASREEAEKACSNYKSALEKVTGLRNQQAGILGDSTIEQLKEETKDIPTDATARDATLVGQEFIVAENELKKCETEIAEIAGNIEKWEKQYGSTSDLDAEKMGAHSSVVEIRKEYETAANKLKGIDDVTAFLEHYQQSKQQLTDLLPQLHDKREKRAALSQPVDKTAAELREELSVAEEELATLQQKHKALCQVRDMVKTIRAEAGESPLVPWQQRAEAMIATVSGGRYTAFDIDEGSTTFKSGQDMESGWLSIGTSAGFGFALRLSMAEYYLEDSDGFLVFDDPMVDLDPERRQVTAELIQEFAREKQVIYLTCHPTHAALFDVEPIKLKKRIGE